MAAADAQSLFGAIKEKYCEDDEETQSVPDYILVPKLGTYEFSL